MKLRTRLAIVREYRKVKKLMLRCKTNSVDRQNIYGAQQALAWVLNDQAMSASRAFNSKP